jgi:hypothetical protein
LLTVLGDPRGYAPLGPHDRAITITVLLVFAAFVVLKTIV